MDTYLLPTLLATTSRRPLSSPSRALADAHLHCHLPMVSVIAFSLTDAHLPRSPRCHLPVVSVVAFPSPRECPPPSHSPRCHLPSVSVVAFPTSHGHPSPPHPPRHHLPPVSAFAFLLIITGVGLPPLISLRCFPSHRSPKKRDADLLPDLLAATFH